MVHNRFTQEKDDFIISEYLSGKNPKQIAIEMGTFNTSIRRVLLRNNIIPLTSAERWSTRKNMFNNDSEEAQYWIGFLAADGCISNENCISLSSAEKDHNHLLKYSNFVNAPIRQVYNKRFDLLETRVVFRDKKIREYLTSIGITPRKSMNIQLNIPLNNHILRGYFDGNGYARKTNGDMEIATGSEYLKNQIREYYQLNNIHSTFHVANGNVYIIGVYSRPDCVKLYELFYKNTTVFLERKKEVLSPFYSEN